MNIFFLHGNPVVCAASHCDKHVNKMIIEHLQMMSVALDVHGLPPAKKKDGSNYSVRGYRKHPCTIWVTESLSNFLWLYEMNTALCWQFKIRYGKEHAGVDSLLSIDLRRVKKTYPDFGFTKPAQAMPDWCKHPSNAVEAYRNYYNFTKWGFATWAAGPATPPDWWAPACSLEAKDAY